MGFTDAEDGTGLGLAIVGLIAEAHAWDVAVGDGTEGGARFEPAGMTWVDAAAIARPNEGEPVD